MEIVRQKNVATVIVFPIVDADGDLVTGAASLDSEIDQWADGANPTGFADCTNEATEIGTDGIYYLSLTQTEMNEDYIVIQVKTATAGAKTQVILIRTLVGDPLLLSTTTSGTVSTAQTGDAFARLGAPAGASVSADVAAVKSDTAAILADTGTDGVVVATGGIAATSFAAGAIDASAIAANAIGASEIATGAIDADALAADAVDEILDDTIGDGTITVRQALRVVLAALAGKLSGAATTTVTVRNTADLADVIVATVDADGNRTAITLTP